MLDFKARVLQAAGPVFREALKVDRVEVVADAAQPRGESLWHHGCSLGGGAATRTEC